MVVETHNGSKAPTTLDAVELQVDEVDVIGNGRHIRIHESAIVTIVVVGPDANGSREVVVDLTRDVKLGTVDILLTLHVGTVVVFVGHHTGLCQQRPDGYFEHGDALVVFHETTATHDTDHGGESPVLLLVGSEECRHDGRRGYTVVLFVEIRTQKTGNTAIDVTVLPGLLEVE